MIINDGKKGESNFVIQIQPQNHAWHTGESRPSSKILPLKTAKTAT